jgi:hypothetical protein
VRADHGGAVEAWPIEELVERVAGLTGDETSADVRATLERLVGHLPEGERIAQRLAHVVSVDGASGAVDETTWAMRTLFEAVFDGPAILVVDDIDRVSFGFSSFLADLARALDATPLLIVCTAAGEPPGITDTLAMALFDVATAERLVAARLGAAGEGVAAAIVGAFGTNPLALDHGLALLVETSALSRDAADGARGGPAPPPSARSGTSSTPACTRCPPTSGDGGGRGAHRHDRPASPLLASDDEVGSAADIERQLAELVAAGIPLADGTTTTFVHPLARETARDRRVAGPRRRGPHPRRTGDPGRRRFPTASSRRLGRTHLAEALLLSRDGAAEDPDRVDAIDLLSTAAEHAGRSATQRAPRSWNAEWPPSWRRTIPSAPSCCSVPPRTRSRPGACGRRRPRSTRR